MTSERSESSTDGSAGEIRTAELMVLLARVRAELTTVLSDMGPAAKTASLRIIDDIGQHIDRSTSPQQIAALFGQRHASFLAQLAQEFPSLTPTELRLCALLRSAIASKDVAALMCCSVRSIEKHRERLRRKFKLQLGENLVTFLAQRRG